VKILYFHQHFSTPEGSTGTRSYEMARALIRAGHEVTMICGSCHGGMSGLDGSFNKGKRVGSVDGIQVMELELVYSNYQSFVKRSWIFLKFAMRSIGIVLREPSDLVFATTTPLTAGLPGIFSRWLHGKKFVFEVRDLWPELPKAMGVITNPIILWLMSVLEWISYHSAHACIGLSPGIVSGIKKRTRIDQPVAMIPNGCDTDLFNRPDISKEPYALLKLIPQTGLRCVFTGAHGIANSLDAVLDAASELIERARCDIHLIFIGNGNLKPHLIKRAADERLRNCVFLDPIPKLTLAKMLPHFDVGLMILDNLPAFYYGTSPNKFFDYISCGMPVLNNYPGWIADIIEENGCGMAIPPDNPAAFANALEFLADHPDKAKQMSRNCRTLAESKFSRADLSNQFVDFLYLVHQSHK